MLKQILMLSCLCSIFATGCQNSVSSNSAANLKNALIPPVNDASQEDASLIAAKEQTTVIAYYFHRTMRCPTCIAIEANAKRAIENGFAEQIAAGKLIWMPINLDEPGGDKLGKEFDVSGSTLVMAEMQDGDHTNHKELGKVWDYIRKPGKFDEYVKSEVKKFLNE